MSKWFCLSLCCCGSSWQEETLRKFASMINIGLWSREKWKSKRVIEETSSPWISSLYISLIISTSLLSNLETVSRFASFVTNNSSRLLGGEQLSGVIISRLYLKKKYVSTCLEKEIVKWKLPDKRIISIYFEETSDLRERNLWFMID